MGTGAVGGPSTSPAENLVKSQVATLNGHGDSHVAQPPGGEQAPSLTPSTGSQGNPEALSGLV